LNQSFFNSLTKENFDKVKKGDTLMQRSFFILLKSWYIGIQKSHFVKIPFLI
jgi:hypothetical protein